MVGHLRWIILLLTVIAICAISSGLAFWSTPDPQTASRDSLLRWLATSDISRESAETRAALIDRLEKEMRDGQLVVTQGQIGRRTAAKLAANVATLKRQWFVRRVNQYHRLVSEERRDFLNARIQTVRAWSKIDASLERAADGEDAPSAGDAAAFFDDIAQWIGQEQDPKQRQRMEQAVFDGLMQWLATDNLADQSPAVRRDLAMRIAQQLDAGLSCEGIRSSRSPAEQAMLRHNGRLLLNAWLLECAERYDNLPPTARPSFIDEQIDRVAAWNIEKLLLEDAGAAADEPAAIESLAVLANQLVSQAPPSQQPKLRRMVSAVQARMLSRYLEDLLEAAL